MSARGQRPLLIPPGLRQKLETLRDALRKSQMSLFDESNVSRHPEGSGKGGQFAPKGTGREEAASAKDARPGTLRLPDPESMPQGATIDDMAIRTQNTVWDCEGPYKDHYLYGKNDWDADYADHLLFRRRRRGRNRGKPGTVTGLASPEDVERLQRGERVEIHFGTGRGTFQADWSRYHKRAKEEERERQRQEAEAKRSTPEGKKEEREKQEARFIELQVPHIIKLTPDEYVAQNLEGVSLTTPGLKEKYEEHFRKVHKRAVKLAQEHGLDVPGHVLEATTQEALI